MKHHAIFALTAAVLTALCGAAVPVAASAAAEEGDYIYEVKGSGAAIVYYGGEETAVDVPAQLGGLPVKTICSGAFSESAAEEITLPDSVTDIQSYAFAYMEKLKTLHLPANLTEIPPQMCLECAALETVSIPETVSQIGMEAFRSCERLLTVELPAAVTDIPASAFQSCSSLQSLILPDTLTSIGKNAFRGCTSLTALNLPDGLETLTAGAFAQCTSLRSVQIPAGIQELCDHVFSQCDSLRAVLIPETVQEIGQNAFQNVADLTIYGAAGSAAEKFAKRYRLAFRLAEEWQPDRLSECDVNGDGAVNVQDAVLLSRYAAEDETVGEAVSNAADLDGDGMITVLDVTLLMANL